MCKGGNLQTAISIDFKKNRIRIHKESLRMIGNPSYIQLLVNVERAQIAIRGIDKKSCDAHKVNMAQIQSDFSYEIYSQSFTMKLRDAFTQFGQTCTYRLAGLVFPQARVAVFDVESIQRVES